MLADHLPHLHLDIQMTRYRRMHALTLPDEQYARLYNAIHQAIDALRHHGHKLAVAFIADTPCLLILDIDLQNPYSSAVDIIKGREKEEESEHG